MQLEIRSAKSVDPETVAERLQPLLLSPLATLEQRNDVDECANALSKKASPAWIMARVASLLVDHYEKDTPQSVREMAATDWLVALKDEPQWAIDKAVFWWNSRENPDRNKRPKHGDIAEKCWEFMMIVRAAAVRVAAFDRGPTLPKPQEPTRDLPSLDRRREMVAEFQRVASSKSVGAGNE